MLQKLIILFAFQVTIFAECGFLEFPRKFETEHEMNVALEKWTRLEYENNNGKIVLFSPAIGSGLVARYLFAYKKERSTESWRCIYFKEVLYPNTGIRQNKNLIQVFTQEPSHSVVESIDLQNMLITK